MNFTSAPGQRVRPGVPSWLRLTSSVIALLRERARAGVRQAGLQPRQMQPQRVVGPDQQLGAFLKIGGGFLGLAEHELDVAAIGVGIGVEIGIERDRRVEVELRAVVVAGRRLGDAAIGEGLRPVREAQLVAVDGAGEELDRFFVLAVLRAAITAALASSDAGRENRPPAKSSKPINARDRNFAGESSCSPPRRPGRHSLADFRPLRRPASSRRSGICRRDPFPARDGR